MGRYVRAVPAEDVHVVPYDERWPNLFDAERGRLVGLLAPWLVGDVEHVGSTSVPGLSAKPIIDMLAGVRRLNAARQAVPLLEVVGYESGSHRPHEALWLFKPAGVPSFERLFHLHLTEVGSDLWRERLVFRDTLRADPGLTAEYEQLKQRLARERADLREYTDGKRGFVVRVLARAGVSLPSERSNPGTSAADS